MNFALLLSPRVALMASAAVLVSACSQTALRSRTYEFTQPTVGPAAAATVAGVAITPARALPNNPVPVYPLHMRAQEINGLVEVEAVVDEGGRVLAANIVSSTHSDLNRPTLNAVRQWKFEPRKVSGVPVVSRVIFPVEFAMEEEPAKAKSPTG